MGYHHIFLDRDRVRILQGAEKGRSRLEEARPKVPQKMEDLRDHDLGKPLSLARGKGFEEGKEDGQSEVDANLIRAEGEGMVRMLHIRRLDRWRGHGVGSARLDNPLVDMGLAAVAVEVEVAGLVLKGGTISAAF